MRFGRKVCFLPVGEQLLHCFEGKKILLYTEGTVKIMNTDNLSVSSDIYMNFVNPPRGYGNVPFYWWNGDVLDTERIDSQLKLLSAGGVSGVQINFCHSCPAHDPKLGGGGFGKTYECTPGDVYRRMVGDCKSYLSYCEEAGIRSWYFRLYHRLDRKRFFC